MSNIKYPNIRVNLTGISGNAFSLLGACVNRANDHKLSEEEIQEFLKEAKSGDYENLVATCCAWFDCY